jgi:hypothetical protein
MKKQRKLGRHVRGGDFVVAEFVACGKRHRSDCIKFSRIGERIGPELGSYTGHSVLPPAELSQPK